MPKFSHYYQAVQYLESLSNLSRSAQQADKLNNLPRTKELVRRLKINLSAFKFIHVAGTAGKGTTVALLHCMLNRAGKKVGSYYSPHPTTSIERIKVGTKYISPADFTALLDKIKPVVKRMYLNSPYGAPTYFEIFLAMALLYFQRQKCEYVILETGCGGEFDATNIISRPLITAITNIGLDHTHLLGKTLSRIARTKAGIIKPGAKFFTTERRPHLLKIFQRVCRERRAIFMPVKDNLSERSNDNFVLAAHIARALRIDSPLINACRTYFKLSCRFEIMQSKPLVVLDGAHNADKLKSAFDRLASLKFENLWLIFTLNANKDSATVANLLNRQLKSLVSAKSHRQIKIYLTRHVIASRPLVDLKSFSLLFSSLFRKNIIIRLDPWRALAQALKKARQNDLILITGSFYLAGELRRHWVKEKRILLQRDSLVRKKFL